MAAASLIWKQTSREWGNGKHLRGNAHAFVPRHAGDDGPVALCGYRPHPRTTTLLDIDPADPPPPCERCLQRKRASEGRLARGA